MVLAAVCGLWDSGHGSGVRPSQVILVGARDIDLAERILLRNAGVRILSPAEANPERVLAEIGSADVWIHIDWDALEPGFVPADYEVPEGILPEQLRSIFAAIPQGRVRGVEIAEYHLPTDKQADEAAITTIQHILGPLFEEQV